MTTKKLFKNLAVTCLLSLALAASGCGKVTLEEDTKASNPDGVKNDGFVTACEEISDLAECGARADCDWETGYCLMYCDVSDPGCCDPDRCMSKPEPECSPTGPIDALCSGYCESGYQIIDGEVMCTCCEPICSPVMCAMYCEYGFKKGADGCEVCDCADAPEPECSPTGPIDALCGTICDSGYLIIDGEVMCTCCESECQPETCEMYCEYGFKTDENGCEFCECADAPEPQCSATGPINTICATDCLNGYEVWDGLVTCSCCEPTCQPVACMLYCEFGFKTDTDGCEICQCADAPEPECSATGPINTICATDCLNGYEVWDGLVTCSCCESACMPVVCALYCEFGFKKNADGCEICDCADSPIP